MLRLAMEVVEEPELVVPVLRGMVNPEGPLLDWRIDSLVVMPDLIVRGTLEVLTISGGGGIGSGGLGILGARHMIKDCVLI